MIEIIFESHATSFDNEKKIASGHFDVALSEKGIEQARELGQRRADEHFDAIFCSDLQRSYKTAELAFGNRYPIFKDARLRECDYGDYEHKPGAKIEVDRINHIDTPFPNGESYEQRSQQMTSFMKELMKNYQGKRVLIIGHRATQYGIERCTSGRSLKEIVTAPWHWQPGWVYDFEAVDHAAP